MLRNYSFFQTCNMLQYHDKNRFSFKNLYLCSFAFDLGSLMNIYSFRTCNMKGLYSNLNKKIINFKNMS